MRIKLKLSTVVPQSVIARIPDRLFIHLLFFQATGRPLNLRNPRTYDEKLQWIKVYGNLEQYAQYADKFAVREYIKQTIGAKYLVPLIGCWDTFEDIPFDKLPKRFALKATHGSGYNYICQDKSQLDMAELEKTVKEWLNDSFYHYHREAQYKHITPRIVCERYLEDEYGELRDYKFYCSNGEPKVLEIHASRSAGFGGHAVAHYDTKWRRLSIEAVGPKIKGKEPKPQNLEEMLTVVRKLAKPFPFVRVDLYSVRGKIYFGELTFTPGDAYFPYPGSGTIKMGKIIDLSGFSKVPSKAHQVQ